MSPEQVAGDAEAIGPVTDVYALGVILYELLTGQRPFGGKGLAVLGQITSGNPPPAPSTLTRISADLEAICLKAMAHEPAKRFQSAAELAKSLAAFQSGHRASEPKRLVRQRSMIGAGVFLGAALIAGYLLRDPGDGFSGHVETSSGEEATAKRATAFVARESDPGLTPPDRVIPPSASTQSHAVSKLHLGADSARRR